jgi:hypothetical protein
MSNKYGSFPPVHIVAGEIARSQSERWYGDRVLAARSAFAVALGMGQAQSKTQQGYEATNQLRNGQVQGQSKATF